MERRAADVRARTVTGTPIYTRTGDDGTTGLLFGGRTSKADPLIEVCGTIDEAVAALGLARAAGADPELHAAILECQRGLFVAAADIAANPRARDRLTPGVSTVTAQMTAALERSIDEQLAGHPLAPQARRSPPPHLTSPAPSCDAPSGASSPRARRVRRSHLRCWPISIAPPTCSTSWPDGPPEIAMSRSATSDGHVMRRRHRARRYPPARLTRRHPLAAMRRDILAHRGTQADRKRFQPLIATIASVKATISCSSNCVTRTS
jgi:hypothetical protein